MKRFSDRMELRRPVAAQLRDEHPATPLEDRLYEASAEAVILVDLRAQTVVEANPRGAKLLGRSRPALIGARLDSLFTPHSRDAIAAGIRDAIMRGHSDSRWVCAAGGGGSLDLRVSVVRNGSESHLLVHIQESDRAADPTRIAACDSYVLTLLDDISDAFFVTDHHLRLLYANRAFVLLAGKACSEELHGESITQWLDLTQSDLDALATQMRQRQGVQFLRTHWLRATKTLQKVMLCAIAVPDGAAAHWGFRLCHPGESLVSS